jgi:hypothetical protein
LKIKEYLEIKKAAKEKPKNFILTHTVDVSGVVDERRVAISYRKLPLGGGNLGAHRDRDFNVEMRKIKNEKRRLGI